MHQPDTATSELIKQLRYLQQFRKKRKRRFRELTKREVEILGLIAGGKNNPAIAVELNISRVTVQNHRASIREKLNVQGQTEYVLYALAYNLIMF